MKEHNLRSKISNYFLSKCYVFALKSREKAKTGVGVGDGYNDTKEYNLKNTKLPVIQRSY